MRFQSSPTPKGGRYKRTPARACLGCCFNPRPPRKVGATSAAAVRPARIRCFNPRPPRKVGATRRPRRLDVQIKVSILAHPERWALHLQGVIGLSQLRFQSSPTPKGGRYNLRREVKRLETMFQSSPTPKGGRYGLTLRGAQYTESFNPRPPRKVGATMRNISW